ncbi:MAG: MgtC/SapB family protein [Candidatus Uhrbacteria bacterium]
MEPLSLLDTIIRLGGAAILCGLIGLEREYRHKPAGLRTDMLVGIGTAAMAIASIEIVRMYPGSNADVSRIASTILTGIGFIGAGSIIQAKGNVLGLTTAASIWVVAAVGLTMGLGMYPVAIAATLMTLIVLIVLHKFKVPENHSDQK